VTRKSWDAGWLKDKKTPAMTQVFLNDNIIMKLAFAHPQGVAATVF
jgi:hypothetical protein